MLLEAAAAAEALAGGSGQAPGARSSRSIPKSRDARLNYARVLVLDKRYAGGAHAVRGGARERSPGNTDVIYAVGLLAFQLKDYAVAEEHAEAAARH